MAAGTAEIVDVWQDNLDEAFQRIIHIVEQYPYVAMVSVVKYSASTGPGVAAACIGGVLDLCLRTPSSRE